MTLSVNSFILLFAATLFVSANACGNKCRFRLCKLDGSDEQRRVGTNVLFRAPKTSLTAYLCRNFGTDEVLDRSMRTGEALVDGTRISQLGQGFPSNYIRLYNVDFTNGLQGIGRMDSTRAQNDFFLTRKCVILPVVQYDVKNTVTGEIRTVGSTTPQDCVSFKPISKRIVVEVAWNNRDDFDLSVVGPNGERGFAANDNSVLRCDDPNPPIMGKEAVLYDDPLPGEYTVQLRHFESCDPSVKTKWVIRVTVDGKTIITRRGKSNRGKNRKVASLKFTL